jgi:phenylalanyl-tRNA synthetase beta chain
LRRSLLPSLLGARRTNESFSNGVIELFEIARVYLPRPETLPSEDLMLALTSGGDFYAVKGAVEALIAALSPASQLRVDGCDDAFFAAGRGCRLNLGGAVLGFLGEVGGAALKQFELRGPTTVAELRLAELAGVAELVPRYVELPSFPAMSRDINLALPEKVLWAEVEAVVRANGGAALAGLEFKEVYRDDALRAGGRKSVLVSLALRSHEGTLTGAQADAVRDRIVAACREKFGAVLRA